MIALFVLALTPLPPPAISGTVVDPQDLAVPGVTVVLTCGDRARSSQTDGRGRFTFAGLDATDACAIDIALDGFAPAHQPVAHDSDALIRLRLAEIKQSVTVAAATALRPSLTGVELAGDDLQAFAGTTTDLVRYARSLAGATTTSSVVYVDGLPAGHALPPIDTIAGISVNADPFSAEYADGDVATVRIVTRAPSRAFRIAPSSDLLGFGGGNALSSGAQTSTTAASIGVRGAIPNLPITFTASASGGRTTTDMPIQAVVPDAFAAAARGEPTAETVNRNAAGSIELSFAPAPALRATVGYRQTRSGGSNAGVGGIVVRDAGFASAFDTREWRTNVSRFSGRFAYEGGAVATMRESSTRANSDGLGMVVGGDAILGGAAMTSTHSARTRWMSKHVVRAIGDRPWSAGVVAAGAIDRSQATPNAHGTLQVESLDAYERAAAGEPVGTWFVTRGAADARYSAIMLSPFLQKTIVRMANVEVNGGIRADYHSELGTSISPRGSMAVRLRGVTLSGGAGLFVMTPPDGVFMRVLENDGIHLQQFVASGVSLADTAAAPGARVPGVRSLLAPGVARPYEVMTRVAIERPFGRFVPGVEATWTQDRRLFGVSRALDVAAPADGQRPDFVDTFESNRRGDRLRLHAQARYRVKRNMFAAHYEWVDAHNHGDGPFAYATDPRNLDFDWARAAAAPHNLTATASIALPQAVSLTLTDTWNSGVPYTITSGLDPAGTGLFTDRAGLPRNAGDGPSFHSLSMYAHRQIGLPRTIAHGLIHLNVAVQADNILGRRNYISIGSVLQSSSYGRPLAAMPGRSVRVLLNLN